MTNKLMLGIISLTAVVMLSACTEKNLNETKEMIEMDHSHMHHSGSSEVPERLKIAENPTFPVGSKAVMHTDHMEGMEGTTATISGAYATTVYAVSYTPTNGGPTVQNHKWVIHEELENAEEAPLKPETEVKLNADHMEGMDGATATIDSATETTVYMVDYTSTSGEKVVYHKWVTESELSSVE